MNSDVIIALIICCSVHFIAKVHSSSRVLHANNVKPSSKICTREGAFRFPNDCKQFYRCVDWSHQGLAFSIFHFVCPRGTIFDEEMQICNFPSKTKPCLVSNDNQTFTLNQTCLGLNCPQTGNTSTDSTIMISDEQSTTTPGLSVAEVTSLVFMPGEISSTTSALNLEFTTISTADAVSTTEDEMDEEGLFFPSPPENTLVQEHPQTTEVTDNFLQTTSHPSHEDASNPIELGENRPSVIENKPMDGQASDETDQSSTTIVPMNEDQGFIPGTLPTTSSSQSLSNPVLAVDQGNGVSTQLPTESFLTSSSLSSGVTSSISSEEATTLTSDIGFSTSELFPTNPNDQGSTLTGTSDLNSEENLSTTQDQETSFLIPIETTTKGSSLDSISNQTSGDKNTDSPSNQNETEDNSSVSEPSLEIVSAQSIEESKNKGKYELMDGSIFDCLEPGFFPHEINCIDFYVCIEILPGVLIADQLYQCPDRYLFDEVTHRCQKESKATCSKTKSKISTIYENQTSVVILEPYLETFFSTPLEFISKAFSQK